MLVEITMASAEKDGRGRSEKKSKTLLGSRIDHQQCSNKHHSLEAKSRKFPNEGNIR